MREFIHSVKFKIIICVFALMLGFMLYAALNAGAASIPEIAVKTITSPFADLATKISGWTKDKLDMLVNAEKYKNENEELRRKISDLNERDIAIDALEAYISALEKELVITDENPDFKWASNVCSIIAWNANDVSAGFTINRGTNDGISRFDLARTDVGVVGVVSETAPNYSKISTILSNDTKIGVLTTRGRVAGIIDNDVIYAKDGLCRIGLIQSGSDIVAGDVVVTIGSDMYPAGQMIGEVVEVFDDPNGLSMLALVKPSEDVLRISDVLIITGFEGRDETIN